MNSPPAPKRREPQYDKSHRDTESGLRQNGQVGDLISGPSYIRKISVDTVIFCGTAVAVLALLVAVAGLVLLTRQERERNVRRSPMNDPVFNLAPVATDNYLASWDFERRKASSDK
jgi:hypothetical protein